MDDIDKSGDVGAFRDVDEIEELEELEDDEPLVEVAALANVDMPEDDEE